MRTRLSITGCLLLAFLLPAVLPGCGDDDDGGGTQPAACSIEIYSPEDLSVYSVPPQTPDADRIDVRWRAAGGGTVRIELLKAGAVLGVTHDETPNDGYQYYDIDDLVQVTGDDYQVRVTSLQDDQCTDTSEMFRIEDFEGCAIDVSVEYPGMNDPEPKALAGDNMAVGWTPTASTGTYQLELWTDPPAVAPEYVGLLVGDLAETSANWTIDSLHRGDGWYKVRVQDAEITSCYGDSEPFFMVDGDVCSIEYLGPEIQGTEEQVEIVWDASNTVNGNVNLELWYGQLYKIASITPAPVLASSGAYMWTVTDYGFQVSENGYKIKIVDADDEYCYDFGPLFSIPR